MRCSDRKGTSFLLKSGIVVTNEHVVRGCKASDVSAESPLGKKIKFSNLVADANRDLAILLPSEMLRGGLELGSQANPPLEAKVSTWGFPLTYEDPAPLLSVGYVAGYSVGKPSNPVKHFIVNGAFNPGNSGGPVFVEGSNDVVGIVVTKWPLFSRDAEIVIGGLKSSPTKGMSNVYITNADGTKRRISNEEAVAVVLTEFYRKVQVMIGEAISISELKAFLREKEGELRK